MNTGSNLALPIRSGAVTVVVAGDALASVVAGTRWANERVALRLVGGAGAQGEPLVLDLRTLPLSWWPELPSTAPLVAIDQGAQVRVGPPGREQVISGPLAGLLSSATHGVVLVPGASWTVQDVVDFCEATPGPCGLAGPSAAPGSAGP